MRRKDGMSVTLAPASKRVVRTRAVDS